MSATASLSWPPSLWAATAPAGAVLPALEGDQAADIVVVGAGFTGLSTAIHLREMGVGATVIEAAEPGWGASGRNNGQGVPGMCGPCGGSSQVCCATGGAGADAGITACMTPLSCLVGATDDVCGTCGATGQPCCGTNNAGTCTGTGLACSGRNAGQGIAGTCGPCGGAGQACCATAGQPADGGVTACTAPLACMVATAGNQCGTCGASGQSCCGTGNNGTCDTGLGCLGRSRANGMAGTCGPCGALAQACCPGGGATACMAGLTCTAMSCMAIPDAGPVDAPGAQ